MKKAFFIGIFLAVLGFSPLANAALINNGNGLIYDTDLNITWYDAPAVSRSWYDSVAWAATLSVTDVNGQNITGWRLPTTRDGQYEDGYDGTTTAGYNITTSNEMGHLFHTELDNKSLYDVTGIIQSVWGLVNMSPFTGLVSFYYWSGTEYALQPDMQAAWSFSLYDGGQYLSPKNSNSPYALAVHDGNVGAPVPIPSAMLLFAPGLAGLAVLRKKIY